MLKPWSRA